MSTSRWILSWVLLMAPVSLAWSFASSLSRGGLILGWFFVLAFSGILGLLQAKLMARYRKPLPRWLPAYVVGSALGWILAQVAGISLRRSFPAATPLLFVVVFNTTASGILALALAWAAWGRRWPPVWPIWVAGLLLLRLVPALAFFGLRSRLPVEGTGAVVAWTVAHGVILYAGLAWLLDRLVFIGDKEPA